MVVDGSISYIDDNPPDGDDLNEQYQTEVDAVDEEITFTNETLGFRSDISTKFQWYIQFQVKDANSPILRLTSRRSLFSWKSE